MVSHRRPKQLQDIYRRVLVDSARFFSLQNPVFKLFDSRRFQSNDLLFSDAAIDFNSLDDRTSYTTYLGMQQTNTFFSIKHMVLIDFIRLRETF